MRHTTLTAEQIAELDEMNQSTFQQRRQRDAGLKLMGTRDSGTARLRNLAGGEVRLYWHVNTEADDWEPRRHVPDGTFIIENQDATIALNAEELRRFLRWA